MYSHIIRIAFLTFMIGFWAHQSYKMPQRGAVQRFEEDNERWLEVYRNIICGYDSVADLTDEERKVIPYVILANQFVCVAWFAEQKKYAELFETNKQMTLWLNDKFEELKDI